MNNYYTGALAELVSHPTPLTYSFFRHWFTGNTSLGKAMKLLGLPCQNNDRCVLDLVNGQLVVNLETEEQTFYKNTLFYYLPQKDINSPPILKMKYSKGANPLNLINTSKITLVQSKWIASPAQAVNLAQNLVNSIPTHDHMEDVAEIDKILTEQCWPQVIAVGILAEFFHQLLSKDKSSTELFWNQVSSLVAKRDWFFQSLAKQSEIKNGQITLDSYFEQFGTRADNDYELDSPRWHEIPQFIEERIQLTRFRSESIPEVPQMSKTTPQIDALVDLQIMRSEARRKILYYIDKLRSAIIAQLGSDESIGQNIREGLLGGNKVTPDSITAPPPPPPVPAVTDVSSGKGLPISPGQAQGNVKVISNTSNTIPQGTIGVFPNATPEFTMQYPQCAGIIFLTGGQTSHGAIVAREFGIPAILDNTARCLQNGIRVNLNGTEGSWSLVS